MTSQKLSFLTENADKNICGMFNILYYNVWDASKIINEKIADKLFLCYQKSQFKVIIVSISRQQ